MPTRLILFSALVTGLLLTGCKVETDLGNQCGMVKRDPTDTDGTDGYRSVPITEGDFPDGEPQGDLISFGALGCEDLVCVQDAAHRKWTGNPSEPLIGYCSRPCVVGSATGCTPQGEISNDTDPDLKMACRSLLLDSATMGRLCQADPDKCAQYFGNTTSPYFCARGEAAAEGDAGTP
jgi:hypothetical protein